jgi:hypothetical protein
MSICLHRLGASPARSGSPSRSRRSTGQAAAEANYKRKRIVVDDGQPANARVRVLIHEIAHAMGVDYRKHSRAQAEVIVDTAIFSPCQA